MVGSMVHNQTAGRMGLTLSDGRDGRDAGDRTAPRTLTPEARRALAEAEERRRRSTQGRAPPPAEVGGRNGPDPVRYGDWEKGGIASDF
jgi:hypothetical protein